MRSDQLEKHARRRRPDQASPAREIQRASRGVGCGCGGGETRRVVRDAVAACAEIAGIHAVRAGRGTKEHGLGGSFHGRNSIMAPAIAGRYRQRTLEPASNKGGSDKTGSHKEWSRYKPAKSRSAD